MLLDPTESAVIFSLIQCNVSKVSSKYWRWGPHHHESLQETNNKVLKMSPWFPTRHIYFQSVMLNIPSARQPSSPVLDDTLSKLLPACIKRPLNSNLALPRFMLCESVVHNALQQQDRGNYHNQSRASSISGEPQGVNEAPRRRRRDRWVSAWERQREVEREGSKSMFVGSPKTPRLSEKCHLHD